MICLDSTPELYTNECASFTTKDFPENKFAETGDIVRCIMLDVDDKRPVDDIFWKVDDYHKLFSRKVDDYHKLFSRAGFSVEAFYKPLGYEDEPFKWISEITSAPWMIFVLKSAI